jgi:pyrimidine oxygenase
MDIGVFIPIANNGWLISKASPQYLPSYDLNREIVTRAEKYGMDFALAMVKLRGFGGDTEFWDYAHESFTLMAGIAAVTERIKLYASIPVLAMQPAIAARMAATIDSIAPGRFGVNIVSGWAEAEYSQMGLWPGDEHFTRRYDYCGEYVTIMKELWETGASDFKGDFFQMQDCRMLPTPSAPIGVVCAGQSQRGMQFCAEYGDHNFVMGTGVNTPTAFAPTAAALAAEADITGRAVASYVLFLIIADETDELAQAKYDSYRNAVDASALEWMAEQASVDKNADETSTAKTITLPEGAFRFNMGVLCGSYDKVAAMLDEAAEVPGTGGIMLVFDDFIEGIEAFGNYIQPKMASRQGILTVGG